jgi:hypothetical protein
MVLQSFFTEREIDTIINALEAQRTKWLAINKRPMQGYGSAKEHAKKEQAKANAVELDMVLSKIVEYTL